MGRTGNANDGGGEGKGNDADDEDAYAFVNVGQRGGGMAGRNMHHAMPDRMAQGAPQHRGGLVWTCLHCTVENQADDQVCWVCSKSRVPAADGDAMPVQHGAHM